jgi:hypothetical protein
MRSEHQRRQRPVAVMVSALLASVALVAGCGDGQAEATARQSEVARLGERVMPFDLDATTHRFEPVDDGLVQTVIADDPGDTDQITLIRQHLRSEAARFTAGDYGDPASIHGDDMPGLAELEAGAEDITVIYEPTVDGGRITYTTTGVGLVAALHRWAEAQVSDHGQHAEHTDASS